LRDRPLAERVLGPPTFRALSVFKRIGIGIAGGALLFAAINAAGTAGNENDDVAYPAAAVFLTALLALGVLDAARASRS
jgi:hypothetical protein